MSKANSNVNLNQVQQLQLATAGQNTQKVNPVSIVPFQTISLPKISVNQLKKQSSEIWSEYKKDASATIRAKSDGVNYVALFCGSSKNAYGERLKSYLINLFTGNMINSENGKPITMDLKKKTETGYVSENPDYTLPVHSNIMISCLNPCFDCVNGELVEVVSLTARRVKDSIYHNAVILKKINTSAYQPIKIIDYFLKYQLANNHFVKETRVPLHSQSEQKYVMDDKMHVYVIEPDTNSKAYVCNNHENIVVFEPHFNDFKYKGVDQKEVPTLDIELVGNVYDGIPSQEKPFESLQIKERFSLQIKCYTETIRSFSLNSLQRWCALIGMIVHNSKMLFITQTDLKKTSSFTINQSSMPSSSISAITSTICKAIVFDAYETYWSLSFKISHKFFDDKENDYVHAREIYDEVSMPPNLPSLRFDSWMFLKDLSDQDWKLLKQMVKDNKEEIVFKALVEQPNIGTLKDSFKDALQALSQDQGYDYLLVLLGLIKDPELWRSKLPDNMRSKCSQLPTFTKELQNIHFLVFFPQRKTTNDRYINQFCPTEIKPQADFQIDEFISPEEEDAILTEIENKKQKTK